MRLPSPRRNPHADVRRTARLGYTLVELLVTTVIALIIMGAVVSLFGTIGTGINNTRAAMNMADRLRVVQLRLQKDLEGITVKPMVDPPYSPSNNKGYFEYTEGPIGPVIPPSNVAKDLNKDLGSGNYGPDTTVGDIDDMLMFTTQAQPDVSGFVEPFTGRVCMKRWPKPGSEDTAAPSDSVGKYVLVKTAQSDTAEVAWFLRGRTLYRRVLLVLPNFDADLRTIPSVSSPQNSETQLDTRDSSCPSMGPPTLPVAGPGFYNDYDISVRSNNFDTGAPGYADYRIFPNSLGDLTKPENRFAHRPSHHFSGLAGSFSGTWSSYPFHPHFELTWNGNPAPVSIDRSAWANLGLPTLQETSYRTPSTSGTTLDFDNSWVAGRRLLRLTLTPRTGAPGNFDAWYNPHPYQETDAATGALSAYPGSRAMEDVILTNVLGFDVKVWDPGAPILQWRYDVNNDNATAGMNPGDDDTIVRILLPGDPWYARALCWREDHDPDSALSRVWYHIIGYGAYVDLNYMCLIGYGADPTKATPNYTEGAGAPQAYFGGPGNTKSLISGTLPYGVNGKDFTNPLDWPANNTWLPAVFDTWSDHYVHDTAATYPQMDNPPPTTPTGAGYIDRNSDSTEDPTRYESEYDQDHDPATLDPEDIPPPYPHAVTAIQVKIRVFDPDSRQIREVTVVQKF